MMDSITILKFLSMASTCSSSWPILSAKGLTDKNSEESRPSLTHKRSVLFKKLGAPLAAAILALSPICLTPVALGQTVNIERGATLFSQACIGCHDGGGNIIQPGATLYTKDLERNGADTEDEIYRITYFGKGRMPGFGEKCTPRGQCTFGPRLKEDEIKLLAEFVKLQADQGWPSISSNED